MTNYLMDATLIIISYLVINYAMNKAHIINSLILLEYLILIVLLMLFKMMINLSMEHYLVFLFLILSITESILGLSSLISLIRTHSNDFMKSTSVISF